VVPEDMLLNTQDELDREIVQRPCLVVEGVEKRLGELEQECKLVLEKNNVNESSFSKVLLFVLGEEATNLGSDCMCSSEEVGCLAVAEMERPTCPSRLSTSLR
jgi:hypothetical protein